MPVRLREINPVEAVHSFPAFPVVLAAVGREERNIITLAMVHVFSFRPTIVGVGIAPPRRSHELFHTHPDFSINIPERRLVEEVLYCGSRSGRQVNKFLETGLRSEKGKRIDSPILLDCPVIMECRKLDYMDVGDHTWFLGEVVCAHRDDEYDRERALLYWAGEFRVLGDMIRSR